MITIATDVVPRPAYHVRRRKYAGVCWLISHDRHFRIDDLVDQVWMCCDGEATLAQISESLAQRGVLSLGEALAATLMATEFFRREGLIDYDEKTRDE